MSEDKKNPVFDEQTLAKLLEAAYVLQEHGHQLRKPDAGAPAKPEAAPRKPVVAASEGKGVRAPEPLPPRSSPLPPMAGQDYSSALAEIVETKHEIEVGQLNRQDALSLIANRLIGINGARGVAVAVRKGNTVSYPIVAGIGTLPAGSEVPLEKALCASALRSAEVFTCSDVDPQLASAVGESRRRGVGSLIVVPVSHETEVVAALEVYYSDPRSFTEQDVNTCQLIAGMVGEVLAAEKPVLDSAVASPDRGLLSPEMTGAVPDKQQVSMFSVSQAAAGLCSNCGQLLLGEEKFCGECGAPRPKVPQATNLANKAVPFWLEIRNREAQVPALEPPTHLWASEATSGAELKTGTSQESEAVKDLITDETGGTDAGNDEPAQAERVSLEEGPLPGPDWSSALSARQFLETIASGHRKNSVVRFWNSRRGDIYLAIAVIVVISVIGLGLRSGRSVKTTPPRATTAASHKARQPAQPDLSPFDRMLISLGLAEAPPPPEEKGNPATQVWIDLHTGLYYCPGTDLYGKTPTGKYATQRSAELDQYQPAYRKTCD